MQGDTAKAKAVYQDFLKTPIPTSYSETSAGGVREAAAVDL
jgi:hypothetical protein